MEPPIPAQITGNLICVGPGCRKESLTPDSLRRVYGMRRSLCLQNNGDDSSTNLEESSRIDGLPQRFEPTSLATSGPTPSEESCLKRAAGCSLERSRKSWSKDSIYAQSFFVTTARNSGWTRMRRLPSSSSTSIMTAKTCAYKLLDGWVLYSRAQNLTSGFSFVLGLAAFKFIDSLNSIINRVEYIS